MRPVARFAASALLVAVGLFTCAIAARMALALDGNDFGRMWYGARAWIDGGSIYDETPATVLRLDDGRDIALADLNPPHVHLLLAPLARASLPVAYGIWLGLNALAIGYASWRIRRAALGSSQRRSSLRA